MPVFAIDHPLVQHHLSSLRERMVVFFTLDNLEYAYLSGRVNALQNALSSILKVKPIIVLRNGLLEMADKVRTRQRAIDHVIASVKDIVGDHPADGGAVRRRKFGGEEEPMLRHRIVELVLHHAGLHASPALLCIDLEDGVHVARQVHAQAVGE